jgi:quercetin dioxygenase-like cupin family protein
MTVQLNTQINKNKHKTMKMFKNLTSLSRFVPIGGGRGKTARTVVLASVAVAGLVTALVRTAVATPPSNVVSSTVVARASFLDPVDIKFKIDGGSEEVIHASEAQDTVMQQIIIGPGGNTGWHSHPGPAVAMIRSGTFALYSSEDPTCTPRIYQAGQAFIDRGQGHVHMGRNLSATENVEIWVTYFDVPPGGAARLDAANPGNCGF